MDAVHRKQAELSHTGLFANPPPQFVKLVTPLCEQLGFDALPLHLHVILGAAVFYQVIFLLSPIISSPFKSYNTLKLRSKINWDIHVVSMVQSILICWLAFLALGDPQLQADRAFGYSAFGADVSALACGYFIWDTYVSIKYANLFGIGFALHGIASLFVFLFGFRPFLMYYGPAVLFFELSTPFLNVHWFLDKFRMTGSKFQLINGLILIITFFTCRIIWGWYITYQFTQDVYGAYKTHPEKTPLWLGVTYVVANLLLNSLNVYWFSKMIDSLRRRAEVKKNAGEHED